jgi:hypothetical protein
LEGAVLGDELALRWYGAWLSDVSLERSNPLFN